MHLDLSVFNDPGLAIALALALGMIAQSLAHHLRLPSIVILLAAGIALGPDGLGLIQPAAIGSGMSLLTGFAVAVILFEGGMNLKFKQLRQTQQIIRRLLLSGGLFTMIGGALATHYILYWPWDISILFGTLAMVTGPTVVNPLLKRLRLRKKVATVLEVEGVLIDAIGAIVAIVALEAVLSPGHGNLLVWAGHVVARLGFGVVAGTAVAILLVWLFRVRRLIPEGTENVFTLSVVLVLFQGSNMIMHESGIAAVIAAGVVVSNYSTRVLKGLADFKEEITVLLIGLLFILLAADVRISQVTDLGIPGLLIVLLLMFIVRPLAVVVATWNSELSIKERLYISLIAPRGIVAAAVASFFAAAFADRGLDGGLELRAMVFMLIAVTVVFAGLTGGPIASILGLRRAKQEGWVILSANPLSRQLAWLLLHDGQEVVCIDTNPEHCRSARNHCTRAIHGNGLQPDILDQAQIDTRRGALAISANEEVNYLFVKKVREEVRDITLYLVHHTPTSSLTDKMFDESDAEVLFSTAVDVEYWNHLIESSNANLQLWQLNDDSGSLPAGAENSQGLLQLALRRNGRLVPVGSRLTVKPGDQVYFLVNHQQQDAIASMLQDSGWQQVVETTNAEA